MTELYFSWYRCSINDMSWWKHLPCSSDSFLQLCISHSGKCFFKVLKGIVIDINNPFKFFINASLMCRWQINLVWSYLWFIHHILRPWNVFRSWWPQLFWIMLTICMPVPQTHETTVLGVSILLTHQYTNSSKVTANVSTKIYIVDQFQNISQAFIKFVHTCSMEHYLAMKVLNCHYAEELPLDLSLRHIW